MKTTADLEAIYKNGMSASHQAALRAVYDAGALDGVSDSKAQADLHTTPQQKQTTWTDKGTQQSVAQASKPSASAFPFAPKAESKPDPLAAVREKLKAKPASSHR